MVYAELRAAPTRRAGEKGASLWEWAALSVALAAYLASFSLPVAPLRPGIDSSIWYAANTYRDYGLEMGRDLVHVFGPMGWLAYPTAGSEHLLPALALSAILHALFLTSVAVFAHRQRAFFSCAALLFVCSVFFFCNPQHLETKVYGIILVWWLMDLVAPRLGLGLLAAGFSALFAFAKFNMAVTLILLLGAQVVIAKVCFRQPWRRLGAKLACGLVPASLLAATSFSAPSSLLAWIGRSMDIAAGNSEAMSLAAPDRLVALALLAAACIVTLGLLRPGKDAATSGILWLVLVSVPLYFEFKHGFVRADAHVYAFFTLVPVAAVTRLLLRPPRWVVVPIMAIVVIASIGPGIVYGPITFAGWVRGLRLEGIGRLIRWRAFQHDQYERDRAAVLTVSLSPEEMSLIGSGTVELIPHDLMPLIGTSLRWRPSPFFQHILVRSPAADSANARHLAGGRGADNVLWTWHDQDGVHPMDRCPLTYRALFAGYRCAAKAGVRLLLKRGDGMRIELEPLRSVISRWGSEVEIPPSPDMVLASVRVRRSLPGRIVRVLYRVPPAYIGFEDGTARRFIPSTAVHGLMVSRVPTTEAHFRHFLHYGRPHPSSHPHRAMRLSCPGSVRHFTSDVGIDFFAVKAEMPS